MARYSFAVYGTPGLKYGQVENNRAYYNVSLFARCVLYRTVDIRWTSVITDPERPAPTHWMLVRNYQGASDNPYQGTIIDSGVINSYRLSAVDNQVLPDTQVTYSFWLYDGLDWINCGNSTTISVAEDLTPTLVKMQKWIPSTWLNASLNEGDAVGEPSTNDFTKVLSAYAFAYDKLRSEAKLLELSTDYKYTPIQLLKNKIEDRGFSYEPTLGDIYHRGVYRVSESVHSTKGTLAGVVSYTTALTHWQSRVEVGRNILLDYNDSSFEESIGSWGFTNTTVTSKAYATSLADIGVTLTAPSPTIYNSVFQPRKIGYGYFVSNSSAATLSLPATDKNIIDYGIPVKGNTRYLVSGYVFGVGNTGTFAITISWYNNLGTLISTTTSTTTSIPASTWTRITSSSDSGTNGKLSPVDAVYARVTVTLSAGTTGRKYALDMFQMYIADGSEEFQDARKVLIYVDGDKINYLSNPSFETNTDTWSAHNGTLSVDTSPSSAIKIGTKAAKFTVTNSELAGFTSDWIPVDPGENLTFSAYVSGPVAKQIYARIEFSALQSAEEQIQILSDAEGQYFPIEYYYLDSDPVLLSTELQRIVLSSVSPTYTIDAGYPSVKVSLFMPDAEVGDIFYADALILEDGVNATTYFDGEGAPQPSNPILSEAIKSADCRWEDEANSKGKSYRWTNYANKIARLFDTLPLVLPNGCSWEIRSGFPTPTYPELESVLESPSFEKSTVGWNGEDATVTRTLTRGSLFDEYATHGVAFGKVTATAAGLYGIESDIYPIDTLAGYYGAIAVKPENEDAHGDYILKLKFYDLNKNFLSDKTVTATIHRSDRWAYIATYARKSEIVGAYYASVEVKCDPEFPAVGRTFYLDRVVFRQ